MKMKGRAVLPRSLHRVPVYLMVYNQCWSYFLHCMLTGLGGATLKHHYEHGTFKTVCWQVYTFRAVRFASTHAERERVAGERRRNFFDVCRWHVSKVSVCIGGVHTNSTCKLCIYVLCLEITRPSVACVVHVHRKH